MTAPFGRGQATAAYPPLRLSIDGAWIGAEDRDALDVIDPATGRVLGRLPVATDADVERAVAAAARAFPGWRATPAIVRARYLRDAADLLRRRRAQWAAWISLELGKPYAQALAETDTALEMLEWAAEEARRLYGRIIPARTPGMRMTAIVEPVGPAAAISGWNAPAITPARKIAAALGAGCTLVLKPSEATPATALMFAHAFAEIGLPAGVLNLVFGHPPRIADIFATHPDIRMLSFTGGTDVGKQLAAKAAASLKRGVYELGGHAPALIFDDCDVEAVATAAAAAKFRNAGQVCTSPTRILVQQTVYARFVEVFTRATEALVVGDPFEAATRVGPLQNARRREAVAGLVADALSHGGKMMTGGSARDGPGFFYHPTILADVPLTARIAREEPFGAVAMVRPFSGIDDAIAEANRVSFGLAAYAFTTNLMTTERLARDIRSGTLAINHWSASFPESPFGGVKDSGIGTEGGTEGIAAFCQTRFVSVQS